MAMTKRWTLVALLAALAAAAGCQNGGAKDKPAPRIRETAEPPPPARFDLQRSGLPESGNWKCDPVFADVNHDQYLDLAAHIRQGPGPGVWIGDGKGTWTPSDETLPSYDHSCGGGLTFADVDKDGQQDLIVADHCRGGFIYLGNGGTAWERAAVVTAVEDAPSEEDAREYRGLECVAVGDINGDDHDDLVFGSSDSGGILMYVGDGTGRNWTRTDSVETEKRWVMRVALADLNGDDRLDLAATCAEGPRVWLGDGQGGWQPASEGLPTPAYQGLFHGLAIADVNEDGRPDVVVCNWVDGPTVYLQQEDGSWSQTADVFPQMKGGGFGIDVGDIDNDRHLDLVVSGRLKYEVGYVYGVFWLRGDGQGNWTYVPDCGLPTTGLPFTWGIDLADFDGDGVLDVAVGSGGVVATNPDAAEPLIPAGVLVWRTRLSDG
jgi:hypothetical protein